MNKGILVLIGVGIMITIGGVVTAEEQDLYPVVELGGCRDDRECYLYCEGPRHRAACWWYGSQTPSSRVLGERVAQIEFEIDIDIDEELKSADEADARRIGITFPVVELGGCNSVRECKLFCDIKENQQSCTEFGERRRLNIEATQQLRGRLQSMLARARDVFDCEGMIECRAFCSELQNQEQCSLLAEQYGPPGLRIKEINLLQQAKRDLECDSLEACRALCNDQSNADRCEKFARTYAPEYMMGRERQQEALRRMQEDLPCDTAEGCRVFCDAIGNREACIEFARKHLPNRYREEILGRPALLGPPVIMDDDLTCVTQEECRQMCQNRPGLCAGFPHRVNDLRLGDKSGLDLMDEMREDEEIRQKSITIIVLTAIADPGMVGDVIGRGPTDYLVKGDTSLDDVVEHVKKRLKGDSAK